jgi:hypothetical protein
MQQVREVPAVSVREEDVAARGVELQLWGPHELATVSPALVIRLRSVPRATSGWMGMDRVVMCPSLVMMMWLLRWRATLHPKRSKALTTSRGLSREPTASDGDFNLTG